MAVPGYNPLTMPVLPIDAISGEPLLQEPPGVEFLRGEVEPWHILVVPVIGEMANAVNDRAKAINERQKYFIKCVLEYNGSTTLPMCLQSSHTHPCDAIGMMNTKQ